jgi:hypothetical protein
MFDFFRKPKPETNPRLPEAKDEYDRAILGDIKRVGWSVIQINEEETAPPYSFSLGIFHTHKHPEIILLGLQHPVAGTIINNIGGLILLGKTIEPDKKYDDFTNSGVIFKTVNPAHYEQYVGYARWLYRGSNFPMMQCVWPLKSGHYPWDAGYPPEGARIQPLLH